MANTIKWSGIEQTKYGLIANWYVSAYYGNDVDINGAGYYNRTTNPTGHGGPTRPFASETKIQQDANVLTNHIVMYDSARYTSAITMTKNVKRVGDGTVVFDSINFGNVAHSVFNTVIINSTFLGAGAGNSYTDVKLIYCSNVVSVLQPIRNVAIIESTITSLTPPLSGCSNIVLINCAGQFTANYTVSAIIINSPNLIIYSTIPRGTGVIFDYSLIIGTVKSTRAINGKTTGVTVEDFKIDGNYFVKSFSEVDLFGSPSGSGATVPQLQTLFNNYFSPVYLDTWQDLDLSLKPTASNMIKFGGLNGTYIGAQPVGHYFSGQTLWDTYRDAVNTSNIDYDMLSKGLVITPGQEFGTFRSTRISLGAPYILEPINFFANLVYNSDGTPRQGVSNQRIDTTPDDLPDNTKNQRVVYDFRLQYSETVGGALTPFLNFELNRMPEVDNSGRSNLDSAFVALERKKIKVTDFIIELTLRRIIIE